MKSVRVITVFAAAAAFTLAGCSSKTPDAASSAPDASTASSAAASDTTSAAAATDLDPQSAAWFSELCEVSDPLNQVFTAVMGSAMAGSQSDKTDPAQLTQMRDGLVKAFGALGDSMTSVGGKLATMDPPGIADGATIASTVVKGLATGGPYMAQLAGKIGSVSTADAKTFSDQLNAAIGSVTDVTKALGVADIKLDDAVKTSVAALPKCQGSLLFSSGF